MKIGIIGGTGFYNLEEMMEIEVETPYGIVIIGHLEKEGKDIFFLPRHGREHSVPPHKVNYLANIQAMKNCRVERIIAINTVGSMRDEIKPGSFFIPNDFIDFTKRASSFNEGVVHIDMSEPFCPEIRKILLDVTNASEGIYIATEGSRLETKAEIRMFYQFGEVVGMTLFPEVVLAREKGICYASLCLVSNWCTGLQDSLSVEEIVSIHEEKKDEIMKILDESIKKIPEERNCGCSKAFEKGKL